MENKRRFTRILFSTPAKLMVDGSIYDTSIVDLSFKGALIDTQNISNEHAGENCNISFVLPESDIHIDISGRIAHIESTHLGITFDKIDIDSMSHLKRLLELNLGNDDLLHRELEALSLTSH